MFDRFVKAEPAHDGRKRPRRKVKASTSPTRSLIDSRPEAAQIRKSLGTRAGIYLALLIAVGCASKDESLGCAELVVDCPEGAEQRWWLAKSPSWSQLLSIEGGECGAWLAYIQNGASARYDDVDLGTRVGQMRLRVLVAAEGVVTSGGTLTLFADEDLTNPITSCQVTPTGGWWDWLVVDCGLMPLTGVHTLTFTFAGDDTNVFNFAAFGVVRSGDPECTVQGPKR
jgi:hypothetical protein